MMNPIHYQSKKIFKQDELKEVHLVESKNLSDSLSQLFIIKIFKTDMKPREINVHQGLSQSSHEILKFIGYWSDKTTNYKYMCIEFCPFGNLYEYIRNRRGNPEPLTDVLNISLTLCKQLMSIHALGYAHGDIKPQNIFLTEGLRPVIGDFEKCQKFEEEREYCTVVGTKEYMAPELIQALKDGKSLCENNLYRYDIYSFAKVIFEFSTAKIFSSFHKMDVINLNNFIDQELDKFNYLESLKNLIKDMLSPDPKICTSSTIKEIYSKLNQIRDEVINPLKVKFKTLTNIRFLSDTKEINRKSIMSKSINSRNRILNIESPEDESSATINLMESFHEERSSCFFRQGSVMSYSSTISSSCENSPGNSVEVSINQSTSSLQNYNLISDQSTKNHIFYNPTLHFSVHTSKINIESFIPEVNINSKICVVCREIISTTLEISPCEHFYHQKCIKIQYERQLEKCKKKINFLGCAECSESINFGFFTNLNYLSKEARIKSNLLDWSYTLAICPVCQVRSYRNYIDENLENTKIFCEFCRLNFCPTCSSTPHFFGNSVCEQYKLMRKSIRE
jgi:serine/threonine protein kinase